MININVKDKIIEVVKLLDELDDLQSQLINNLSESDLKLSDLYHYIESHKMDAKKCCRMIKELKNVLLKRREIKINLAVITSFEMQKQKITNKDNRKIMLSQVCKCYKDEGNDYGYRFYNEEELNKFIGG